MSEVSKRKFKNNLLIIIIFVLIGSLGLSPLQVKAGLLFKEIRQWQVASDATLTTMRPESPDGANSRMFDQVPDQIDLWDSVKDDPDSPITSDYISNQASKNAYVFMNLTATDSDFNSMVTLFIDFWMNTATSFSNDSAVIYAQVFQSDEIATLTSEESIATDTSTGYLSVEFTTVTGSNKATWNAARLRIRVEYSQGGGPDGGQVHMAAVELDGTYAILTNNAPAFTTSPFEDPASISTSPTNEGSNVTFKATADDPENDNYYLAICKTDAVTPGTGAGAPTCGGGNWCISGSTADTVQATCFYTALNGDSESNDWYGFACDAASSSQACSTADQGTGDSGFPFKVNHIPSFSVYSDDSPKNPGELVTWNTTALDTDSDGTPDEVTLYVCDSSGFTGGSCTGTQLCASSASASNPTCGDTLSDPKPDGDWDAYGYVVDNHGLEASGGSHGTDSVMTVNNIAPSITDTTIQLLDTSGSGPLTLTTEQGETEDFLVKFVVVDNNSCENITSGDEIASAIIHVYRSAITQAGCDIDGEDNANNCYANAEVGTGGLCVQDTSVNPCSGTSDSDVGWRCEFPLQYHADPTDGANLTDSTWWAQNWLASVKATDDDALDTGLIEDADGEELASFLVFNLSTANIVYGSVGAGDDSVEQTATLQATGNVGLDENLSGGVAAGHGMCTDYPGCSAYTIAVGQQKYNLTASQGWGGAGSIALTFASAEAELNCLKTTTTGAPTECNTYWILRVPGGQDTGSYTGENTIDGVTGEAQDW